MQIKTPSGINIIWFIGDSTNEETEAQNPKEAEPASVAEAQDEQWTEEPGDVDDWRGGEMQCRFGEPVGCTEAPEPPMESNPASNESLW